MVFIRSVSLIKEIIFIFSDNNEIKISMLRSSTKVINYSLTSVNNDETSMDIRNNSQSVKRRKQDWDKKCNNCIAENNFKKVIGNIIFYHSLNYIYNI